MSLTLAEKNVDTSVKIAGATRLLLVFLTSLLAAYDYKKSWRDVRLYEQKIDEDLKNNDTNHNITATLSTRKGVAQPWRFFFACCNWLSRPYA